MTQDQIPTFQRSPFGTLVSEATVTRLIVDEAGYIVGAEIKDLNRNPKILRARVYVIACGGLETPRLLLLSRSAAFPNGIGNNHDLVGRFFMEHRTYTFRGQVRFGWRTFSLLRTAGQSYQFYKESKDLGLGGTTLNFWLDPTIDPHEIKGEDFGEAFSRVVTQQLEIEMDTEMKSSPENRVSLDATSQDYFGNPGTSLSLSESEEDVQTVRRGKRIVRQVYADLGIKEVEEDPNVGWGHHHMGTCRMGDNPQTSVVDRNLRVHGTKNLFVAGSSVFVTSGTANPTLTLTALALRLTDHLRSHLQDGAFPAPRESALGIRS
jgi:choline dehydrogenase-like flavoprotein